MYQIIFSKNTLKSLKKIPTQYQVLIKKKLEKISLDPFTSDIRKLSADYDATHRFRVGDYRLFLSVDVENKIIEVDKIKRRTTQTYR